MIVLYTGGGEIASAEESREGVALKKRMLADLAELASDTDCAFCRVHGVRCSFTGMPEKEREDFFLGRDRRDLPCAQAISDRIRQVLEINGD